MPIWPLVLAMSTQTTGTAPPPAPATVAPAQPACTAAEHRQFDFWIGEWDVQVSGQPAGSNSVQLILSDCVIMENWSGAGGNFGARGSEGLRKGFRRLVTKQARMQLRQSAFEDLQVARGLLRRQAIVGGVRGRNEEEKQQAEESFHCLPRPRWRPAAPYGAGCDAGVKDSKC